MEVERERIRGNLDDADPDERDHPGEHRHTQRPLADDQPEARQRPRLLAGRASTEGLADRRHDQAGDDERARVDHENRCGGSSEAQDGASH